jgi:hypothetical protein
MNNNHANERKHMPTNTNRPPILVVKNSQSPIRATQPQANNHSTKRLLAGITAVTIGVSGTLLITPPASAAPGYSQASAQYLSGSLLTIPLEDLAELEGVQARTAFGETVPQTNRNNLNLNVLGDTVTLQAPNGVQIPVNIADAGVLGQYAQANPDGSSRSASGLVGSDGTVGVPADDTNPPGNLTLDLTDALGTEFTDEVTNVTLSTGVNSASASQGAPEAAVGDYNITGLTASADTEALEDVSSILRASVDPVQAVVDGAVGPDGSIVDAVTGLVPGDNVVTSDVSLDLDLDAVVDGVLAENEVLGAEGPVTVNLTTGVITVDIAALLAASGQDINNLPANTEVLTPEILDFVSAEVNELLDGLVVEVDDAVQTALQNAVLNVNVTVGDETDPLLDIAINDTLGDIAAGVDLGGVLTGDASVIGLALAPLAQSILDVNVDTTGLLDPVRALYPVLEDALASVASLTVNNQSTENGVFTETALALALPGVLGAEGDLATLNLASASVGPNAIGDPDAPVDNGTPVLSTLTPTSGPEAGGTNVTITGSGFSDVEEVRFGDTPATSVTVVSDTELRVLTPAGTGEVDVTLVDADGNESAANGTFTYTPVDVDNGVPVLSDLTPTTGPETGGTIVTVTGSGFTDVEDVLFGDVPATSVTVVSDTELRVVAPAGTGEVPVTLVDADGNESEANGTFTYVADDADNGAPVVAGFTPASGPEEGGTVVTVTGSGFDDLESIRFGDVPAESVTVVSDTELRVLSPAGTGSVDITLVDTDGNETVAPGEFNYVPADNEPGEGTVPLVTGFTPITGSEDGGTVVTVTGAGFTDADGVLFDGNPGTNFTIVNDNTIRVTTPAGTGAVPVTVVDTQDGNTIADGTFTYVPEDAGVEAPPAVVSFTPASGLETGGTVVDIVGSGFDGTDEVLFGDTPATEFTVVNDGLIRATTPVGTGSVSISIVEGEDTAISEDSFTYVPVPVDEGDGTSPVVTGFTPKTGPEEGGTIVTITGTGFIDTEEVFFDGVAARSFRIISDTELQAVTPAGNGTATVTVRDVSNNAFVLEDPFVYIPEDAASDAPVIVSVTPNSGSEDGGTVVTIIGSGFTDVVGVSFGDKPGTELTIISDTEIRVTAPAGEGDVELAVIDADDNTSDAGDFSYIPEDTDGDGNGDGDTPPVVVIPAPTDNLPVTNPVVDAPVIIAPADNTPAGNTPVVNNGADNAAPKASANGTERLAQTGFTGQGNIFLGMILLVAGAAMTFARKFRFGR